MNKIIWVLVILVVAILGILLWQVLHKDDDLDEALSGLNAAKEEIQAAKQSLDSSILTTQGILERNLGFQKYIGAVDSITKKRDVEAKKREQSFRKDLADLNESIAKLKAQVANVNPQLPEIPTGQLRDNP